MSNAIKHTQRSGNIRFSLKVEDGFGIVEVFNPGRPIPLEIRTRMFDRFYRADPARSQREASHGLGLAIVKAIAEMHGGQVLARSGGGGNTIGFRIPWDPAYPDAQPQAGTLDWERQSESYLSRS